MSSNDDVNDSDDDDADGGSLLVGDAVDIVASVIFAASGSPV